MLGVLEDFLICGLSQPVDFFTKLLSTTGLWSVLDFNFVQKLRVANTLDWRASFEPRVKYAVDAAIRLRGTSNFSGKLMSRTGLWSVRDFNFPEIFEVRGRPPTPAGCKSI